MRVAMIGTGYVGLVSGACFADFGHDVICVDKDPSKIKRLERGEIPIFEPGLDDLVAANVRGGRLSFALDAAEAIRTAFAEAKIAAEHGEPLTLSAGVAVQGEGETGEQTLGRADAALLRAKKAGRNCTFLHDGAGVQAVGSSV